MSLLVAILVSFTTPALASSVITCDLGDARQLQFQFEDNVIWVLEKTRENTVFLSHSVAMSWQRKTKTIFNSSDRLLINTRSSEIYLNMRNGLGSGEVINLITGSKENLENCRSN